MSTENKSWIPWTRIGFTDEEIKHMKENPIKSSCAVCHRDLTGLKLDKNFPCEAPPNCPMRGDGGW